MDLVVLEEIKQLKYRYLRALDLKQWDEFAATLLPEATGDYGDGLRFGSRAPVGSRGVPRSTRTTTRGPRTLADRAHRLPADV